VDANREEVWIRAQCRIHGEGDPLDPAADLYTGRKSSGRSQIGVSDDAPPLELQDLIGLNRLGAEAIRWFADLTCIRISTPTA